jgi:hypothetical protein
MSRTIEILQLSALSASVLLLGFALCFPFFSFLPLMWSAGLAITFILYFAVCLALRRKTATVVYLVIGLVYSITFTWTVYTFTGVEHLEQYACAWNEADAGVVEIDLSPFGGFGRAGVASEELTEHLRKDQPPKVQVTLPIVRDFGRVRARGIIERVDSIRVREVNSWRAGAPDGAVLSRSRPGDRGGH